VTRPRAYPQQLKVFALAFYKGFMEQATLLIWSSVYSKGKTQVPKRVRGSTGTYRHLTVAVAPSWEDTFERRPEPLGLASTSEDAFFWHSLAATIYSRTRGVPAVSPTRPGQTSRTEQQGAAAAIRGVLTVTHGSQLLVRSTTHRSGGTTAAPLSSKPDNDRKSCSMRQRASRSIC
jgi:hypothetical protein